MIVFSCPDQAQDNLAQVAQRQVTAYQQVMQRHDRIPIQPLEIGGYPNLPVALHSALNTLTGSRLGIVDTDGVLIPGVNGVGILRQPSTRSILQWKEEFFPADNRAALEAFMENGSNIAVATSISPPFLRRQGPLNNILKGLGIENIIHFPREKEQAWHSRQDLKSILTNLLGKLFTEEQLLNLMMIEDVLHPARRLSKKADKGGAAGAAIAHLTGFVQGLIPKAQLAPHLMLINSEFQGPQRFDQESGSFYPLEP
jgi:hypothetical protein